MEVYTTVPVVINFTLYFQLEMWKMELQRWKIFQYLDPAFTADIKRAYMVGIKSYFGQKRKADTPGILICCSDETVG